MPERRGQSIGGEEEGRGWPAESALNWLVDKLYSYSLSLLLLCFKSISNSNKHNSLSLTCDLDLLSVCLYMAPPPFPWRKYETPPLPFVSPVSNHNHIKVQPQAQSVCECEKAKGISRIQNPDASERLFFVLLEMLYQWWMRPALLNPSAFTDKIPAICKPTIALHVHITLFGFSQQRNWQTDKLTDAKVVYMLQFKPIIQS